MCLTVPEVHAGWCRARCHADGLADDNTEVCLPLLIIFQNILDTGIYPSQWKLANVTPVHKKKDKQAVGNYRPISLLPIFNKMFERIVFKNIYNFLIKNNLISKHQSGFRPGDSCGSFLLPRKFIELSMIKIVLK